MVNGQLHFGYIDVILFSELSRYRKLNINIFRKKITIKIYKVCDNYVYIFFCYYLDYIRSSDAF